MSGRDGILSIEEQEEMAAIETLPSSLRDIAETYDLRLVMRLVQEFGGVRLKVPEKHHPDTEIVRRLGEEDAAKIIHHCGAQKLDIPRSLIRRKARKQLIIMMYKNGKRQVDIAREVGCTDRQVRNYLVAAGLNKPIEPPGEKKQIDMF